MVRVVPCAYLAVAVHLLFHRNLVLRVFWDGREKCIYVVHSTRYKRFSTQHGVMRSRRTVQDVEASKHFSQAM